MSLSLYYSIDTWIVSLVQFAVMLLCIRLGQFIASKNANYSANTAIATSVYGLLALLLAFTFNMSGDRFKTRKQLVIQEATQISTAIMRTELYADSVQPRFIENFRPYLESRIKFYEALTDTVAIRKSLQEAEVYRKELWKVVAENSRIPQNLVASNQMVPALNQVFDTATTRYWMDLNRTPASIFTMLFTLSFAAAFLGGYNSVGKEKFDWFLATGFCLFTSLVIFFVIDLDKPRSGVITLDNNQKAMTELRLLLDQTGSTAKNK